MAELDSQDRVPGTLTLTPGDISLAAWAADNLNESENSSLTEAGYNSWADLYESYPGVALDTVWVDDSSSRTYDIFRKDLPGLRLPVARKLLIESAKRNTRAIRVAMATPIPTLAVPQTKGKYRENYVDMCAEDVARLFQESGDYNLFHFEVENFVDGEWKNQKYGFIYLLKNEGRHFTTAQLKSGARRPTPGFYWCEVCNGHVPDCAPWSGKGWNSFSEWPNKANLKNHCSGGDHIQRQNQFQKNIENLVAANGGLTRRAWPTNLGIACVDHGPLAFTTSDENVVCEDMPLERSSSFLTGNSSKGSGGQARSKASCGLDRSMAARGQAKRHAADHDDRDGGDTAQSPGLSAHRSKRLNGSADFRDDENRLHDEDRVFQRDGDRYRMGHNEPWWWSKCKFCRLRHKVESCCCKGHPKGVLSIEDTGHVLISCKLCGYSQQGGQL